MFLKWVKLDTSNSVNRLTVRDKDSNGKVFSAIMIRFVMLSFPIMQVRCAWKSRHFGFVTTPLSLDLFEKSDKKPAWLFKSLR